MKKLYGLLIWIACISSGNTLFAENHVIDEIPAAGIVIDQPGTYYFKKNLSWSPVGDGAAITVLTNDVVIDLKGFTLKSSSTNFKTTGISALTGQNVTIKNGKIKNMGLAGIQCTFCANVSVKRIEVDGLNFENVVDFVVPTGILASECLNVSIDKCTVKNIDVKTASCAGIQLTATLISKVTNCKIKNLLNRDGACSGIGHIFCDDLLIESCRVSGIKTTFIDNLNTQGHTAIGLIPTLSINIVIDKCKIKNIKGCCDDAHGMSVFLCENAVVKRSSVSGVTDGLGKAKKGAKATGIEIYAENVQVSDCSVRNIFAINPEDKQATGFSVGASDSVQFIGCKATNVQVFDEHRKQRDSLGYGTGFGWAPDPRPNLLKPALNVLYRDCTAKDCQVGFDSWFHIDSVWDRVISDNNDIAVLNLGSDAQRTLSCTPCSECGCTFLTCFPTPYVVTVTNEAQNNSFLALDKKGVILKGE